MLTKIIYKNFRSNLKNYILFFLSNIVASMELFVFRVHIPQELRIRSRGTERCSASN